VKNPIAFLKAKYWKRQVKKGVKVLQGLDGMMVKAGYNRKKRKQFWRDFTKSYTTRDKIFKQLREEGKDEQNKN